MKEKRLHMQTEFYTNLNKKVDVILFFIYWTWTCTCHAQIYWGVGGGGEGCLEALRKMLQVARYCNPAAEKNYSIRGDDKYICEDSSLLEFHLLYS